MSNADIIECGLMETYALNVGGGKCRGIPIVRAQNNRQFLSKGANNVSQTALRYVLIMIGTRAKASKITIQAHELSRSLTRCEDAQKESENQS